MGINRRFFFDTVRRQLFAGRLAQGQVNGMTAILDKWEAESPDDDDRHLAYMLATAYHETARTMQPVRETLADSDEKAIAILDRAFAQGRLPWVSTPYWRRDGEAKSWLGRGLVQITHKRNYAELSAVAFVDLVEEPDLAMRMDVALNIMFGGMRRGMFTGRALSDCFNASREDWRGARRIINSLDRAEAVADYGRSFYGAIGYTVG